MKFLKSLFPFMLISVLTGCQLLGIEERDLSVPTEDATLVTDVAKVAFLTSDMDGNGKVEGNEWLVWSSTVFLELNKLYMKKKAEEDN